MPVITIEAGLLTKEQKRKLAVELTQHAADIMKVPKEIITLLIKENNPENVGFAGEWLGEKG